MVSGLAGTGVLIATVTVLAGCISVDSKVWDQVINKAATRNLSGEFSNDATYRSSGEFVARGNFAELLDVPARNAADVRMAFEPDGSLKITWFTGDEIRATRTFGEGSGLAIAEDGAIELVNAGGWVHGEGAFGYQSSRVRLFVNENGDLATIQSGGGGGLWGPIPLGIYAKHLAIFPRKR